MYKYTVSYSKFLEASQFTTYENYHSRISNARLIHDFPKMTPIEVVAYIMTYVDKDSKYSDFEILY